MQSYKPSSHKYENHFTFSVKIPHTSNHHLQNIVPLITYTLFLKVIDTLGEGKWNPWYFQLLVKTKSLKL